MISAVLLAAGESRRMGRLKQLLPFGDSTIIENCINNLLNAQIDELIVVLGHRAEEVAAQISHYPVKIVVNKDYRNGMTSSVKAGLAQIDEKVPAMLLALVDQPRIPSTVIDRLIKLYQTNPAIIVKPQFQGVSGHPIIIDLSCRAEIMGLAPDEGLHLITRAYKTQTIYLPVETNAVVEDIDTPTDYQKQKESHEEHEV